MPFTRPELAQSAQAPIKAAMNRQQVLAIVEACAGKDPNMSASVPADMVRRGLSLEQVSAELHGIAVTAAADALPEVATVSRSGPSLARRMAEKFGVGVAADQVRERGN